MTAYEQKLQERADAMAHEYFNKSDFIGFNLDSYIHKDGYIERFIGLAALSLKWSAEDYENGWEDAFKNRLQGGSLIQHKILHGLRPINPNLIPHNEKQEENG